MLQNGQPVAYASRALTETQQRYAQIEREMLAVIYGCEKFHHYIYGRSITIETDHKPLLAIHRKPVYQATPRLQRMLMRLQRYDVQLKYVPGKEMFISDALSRAFLKECKETLVNEDIDVNFFEQELPMTEKKLQELKDATEADEQFQTLADIVRVGWPETREQVPTCVRMFWNFRDEITVLNGLLYKGQSVMIPSSLRRQMLTKLHEPHLGIVKTKQRARNIIFWPNMNYDLEQLIQSCATRSENQTSNNLSFHMKYRILLGQRLEQTFFISRAKTICYWWIITRNTQTSYHFQIYEPDLPLQHAKQYSLEMAYMYH